MPKRRRAAALKNAGALVGRVTPCAPPWQTRTCPLADSGAQRTARPTRALTKGRKQLNTSFCLFNHEHLNGFATGHKFEAELV